MTLGAELSEDLLEGLGLRPGRVITDQFYTGHAHFMTTRAGLARPGDLLRMGDRYALVQLS
jgi:hypothetical protein